MRRSITPRMRGIRMGTTPETSGPYQRNRILGWGATGKLQGVSDEVWKEEEEANAKPQGAGDARFPKMLPAPNSRPVSRHRLHLLLVLEDVALRRVGVQSSQRIRRLVQV